MKRLRLYVGGYTKAGRKTDYSATEAYLTSEFEGWTRYNVVGSWQGTREPSRVYEVISPGHLVEAKRASRYSREVAKLADQNCVLLTLETVKGEFTNVSYQEG